MTNMHGRFTLHQKPNGWWMHDDKTGIVTGPFTDPDAVARFAGWAKDAQPVEIMRVSEMLAGRRTMPPETALELVLTTIAALNTLVEAVERGEGIDEAARVGRQVLDELEFRGEIED